MPWYQSFESISKLLILVAGLVLLFTGETEIGMALLASAGFLAAAKVADNKRNGNGSGAGGAAILLLVFSLAFLGSCQAMKGLPVEVIDLNLQVYDIHDDYVMNDANLDNFSRQQLLRSTMILRQIMQLLRTGVLSVDLLLLESSPPAE